MPKAVSKAQAGLFGAIAAGKAKVKGISKEEAKIRLRGVQTKKLPAKAKTSK